MDKGGRVEGEQRKKRGGDGEGRESEGRVEGEERGRTMRGFPFISLIFLAVYRCTTFYYSSFTTPVCIRCQM